MGRIAITIAGAVVGAVVGYYLGAPLQGAALGASLGGLAGGLLFPEPGPHTTNEGARLTDLHLTASTYGLVQPLAFGRVKVAGNIIWGTEIQEHKTTTETGGGKGGTSQPTQTTIEFVYTVSFALALCRGPATGVVRIWLNSTLVYDPSGVSGVFHQKEGVEFRFYPGDEDQLPDSLIEADKGVGNVPAHRGLCYLVFVNLPLADYGNRLPNVQVELAFGAATPTAPLILSNVTGTTYTTMIAIDALALKGYCLMNVTSFGGVSIPTAQYSIVEFNLTTMVATKYRSLIDMNRPPDVTFAFTLTAFWFGADRYLYYLELNTVTKIDPVTFFPVLQIDISEGSNIFTGFNNVGYKLVEFRMIGPNGPEGTMAVARDGTLQPALCFPFDDGGIPAEPLPIIPRQMVTGLQGRGEGHVYGLYGDTQLGNGTATSAFVMKHIMGVHVSTGQLGDTQYLRGVTSGTIFTIAAADLDPSATVFRGGGGLGYDSSDDSVIFRLPVNVNISGTGASLGFVIKISSAGEELWRTRIEDMNPLNQTGEGNAVVNDLKGNTYAFFNNADMIVISLTDGAIISRFDNSAATFSTELYSSRANSILYTNSGGGAAWRRIPVGIVIAGSTTMAAIFGRLSEEAGLLYTDYDVTALTGIVVDGFIVPQRTSAVAALRPLAQLYHIDAIERDDEIVYQTRGGAIQTTVTQASMVRASDGQNDGDTPYVETRVQEIDLPASFSVSYIDIDHDQQVNTQIARRVLAPQPTVRSSQQMDLQVGVVMGSALAAQRAEILLYTEWMDRHQFKVRLPPEFAARDPADPVTLTLDNGYTMRGRLLGMEVGVDGSVQTTIVEEVP